MKHIKSMPGFCRECYTHNGRYYVYQDNQWYSASKDFEPSYLLDETHPIYAIIKEKGESIMAKEARVFTIADFTGQQPQLRLECEACNAAPDRIGAKFCSNCGATLNWDTVKVRQPEAPAEETKS